MEQAVIITTDGTKSLVEFEIGDSYELLSNTVGGYIECVNLDGMDMWLNEEGKLDGLPQNPLATGLYTSRWGYHDIMVGNVVITGGVDEEGNTIGLTDEQVESIMTFTHKVYGFYTDMN